MEWLRRLIRRILGEKMLRKWQYRILPYRIRWEKYVAKHPKFGAYVEALTGQVVWMVGLTIVAFILAGLWVLIPRTGPLSIIGVIIGGLLTFALPVGVGLFCIVVAVVGLLALIREFIRGLVYWIRNFRKKEKDQQGE